MKYPSLNIVTVSWAGCVGHRKGCSTVDESVLYKEPTHSGLYVSNPTILRTFCQPSQGHTSRTVWFHPLDWEHYKGPCSQCISSSYRWLLLPYRGKMAILLHVKHLLARLLAHLFEARRKIFSAQGTVSILQLLSKLNVSCVGGWWLDRASICKRRDHVCAASPVNMVGAVLAKHADRWECKATSSKSVEEIETGPACAWRWSWKLKWSFKVLQTQPKNVCTNYRILLTWPAWPSDWSTQSGYFLCLDSYHNEAARQFGFTFFDHVVPMQWARFRGDSLSRGKSAGA